MNGSSGISFQTGGGNVVLDLGATYVFGTGSTTSEFRISGPAYEFSGDAIQFESGSRLRVSNASHTFSNDWILNGFTQLQQLGTSSSTNEDFFHNGTITGSAELEVYHLFTIGGDYAATGDLDIRGGALGGALTVNGTVSSNQGTLILSSSASLTGSGSVNKKITGALARIRGLTSGGTLTLNGDVDLSGGTTSSSRNFIQRLVATNGTLTFQDNSRSVISGEAILSGTGDIMINPNAIVTNDGTVAAGHLLTVTGGEIQGAGIFNGDVINNGGFVRGNTFNGQVTQNDGALTEGIFNGAVTVNAGDLGIAGSQQITTFNNVVQIAGNANAVSTLITGTGTLEIDAVLTFNNNVDFSDTINWVISGSTAGDLGNDAAGSFLGNNVVLNGGQLNGTSTSYVVAGNFDSTGNSTLNQSISINGIAEVGSGALTIAPGGRLRLTL